MSEKPTAAKLVEFEKSKEAACESKEGACSKKEQIPIGKPMEDVEKTVEKAEESTIVLPEIHTSDKSEKLEDTEINQEAVTKALADTSFISFQSYRAPRFREPTKFETFHSQASSVELEEPHFLEIRPTSEICSESSSSKSEFHEVPEVSQKLHPKTTSEMSTSAELEASEIPNVAEVCQRLMKATFGTSVSNEPEDRQVPELCQMSKIIFETPISTKLEASEIPDIAEVYQRLIKTQSVSNESEDPEAPEIRRTHSMSKISDKTEEPEIPEVRRTHSTTAEISVPIKFDDVEDVEADGTRATSTSKSGDDKVPIEFKKSLEEFRKRIQKTGETGWRTIELPEIFNKSEKLKDIQRTMTKAIADMSMSSQDRKDNKDDDSKVSTKLEESSLKDTKSAGDTGEMAFIIGKKLAQKEQYEIISRKIWPPMPAPNFKEPHLVLATYRIVPSLPIALFEILAEMIEVVTKRPVVLLHECRKGRPIATEIIDIVVLPAYKNWSDGVLLPASFVFEHHLNRNNSALTYADVIVTNDCAPHIKNIMDLRGHRCAILNERGDFSAARLLFNHLYLKGENILFFSTILEAETQPEVLKMVASKQAEVGIVDSTVFRYHKSQPGMESIHVLTSIGPLPPYRIMIKDTLADKLAKKLTTYLLNAKKCREWMERLSPFGILGFDENSMDYYKMVYEKPTIDVNIPYY